MFTGHVRLDDDVGGLDFYENHGAGAAVFHPHRDSVAEAPTTPDGVGYLWLNAATSNQEQVWTF